MKQGLVIGKFELPHKGHEDLLKKIDAESNISLINLVLTGNGNNFFPYEVRKEMMQTITDKLDKEWHYFHAPDINDPVNYASYIQDVVGYNPKNTILFSNNPETIFCFENKIEGYKSIPVVQPYSSSRLMEMLVLDAPWQELVPEGVRDYVVEKNLKEMAKENYYRISKRKSTPMLATDMLIEYQGGLVLIERKYKPHGCAIPGGMHDKGLTGPENAAKEAKEETNLDIEIIDLLEARTHPRRDPRNHVVSLVYVAKGTGELKGGDDAKNPFIIYGAHEIPDNLAFDHKEILINYYTKYKKGERIEPT